MEVEISENYCIDSRAIRKNKNFYFDNINTHKNFIHVNDVVNIIDRLIEKILKIKF